MKLMKLITTIAITICIALMAYEGFQLLGGDNTIHTGVNFILIVGVILSLISFRLSIQKQSKFVVLQLLLVITLIAFALIISINKDFLLSIWNYTVAVLIIQQGIILLPSKKPSKPLLLFVKYLTLVTMIVMAVICIFKIGKPAVHTSIFYALIAVSIGAFFRIFIKENQSA